uniref:Cilia- and flagella-associated protein 58 central coiled coil domain-containing protein n=1 Tax=Biomphalaria glabrata TaxID=6526 RepID=A0A2C9K519_BIOGL
CFCIFKQEVEKAWKMVDAAHEKEVKSKETAQRLKAEIEQLSKLVEQGAGLSMGQDHSVNELLKVKEDLTRERDDQLTEITKLRDLLAQAKAQQQKLEADKADAEEKIQQLNTDIQMRNNEAQREGRKRDKLERDLTQAKADLDSKNSEIKKMQSQIEHYKEEKDILDQQLKEQRVLSERTLKDAEVLNNRLQKLTSEYESQLISADNLAQENQTRAAELKLKEDELNNLKNESQRQNKLRETVQRKLRTVEDSKADIEQQKELLKGQITGLERDCKTHISTIFVCFQNLLKAAGATQKQLHLVKLHDQSKKNLEQEIANYKEEAQKQRKIIYQLEKERDRYINEASDLTQKVISERDILGTQLVRRNDELALLYEKIKIQQSVLNKGEVQYNQRIEDIRILKLEIKKMRREKFILQKSVANVEDLRREVYHIQRELLRERTRCKALEEELENPMNIHRWRKLEGSDPSTFEMIQKIHTLQKRLIQKTEEVVEKELLIQEKEKLYLELKHILARQPGPEVAEQLTIYQQTLKEKTKQMKGMVSELNMYEAQVGEYKYEIERIARELQEVKKKYFMQKKKEQIFK